VGEYARELGDHEYSRYALFCQMSFAALSGEALPDVQRRIELWRDRSEDFETAASYHRMYAILREPSEATIDWDVRLAQLVEIARRAQGVEQWTRIHSIAVLCLMGEFERAATAAESAVAQVSATGAVGSALADFTLFRGLAQAARLDPTAPRLERWRRLRVLRRCARQLRVWAREGGDFAHMTQLLQAEIWRVSGRGEAALRQYQDAAQAARKLGYVQHAALCHERRGRLLEQRGRDVEAASAYSTARDLYREWGAHAKVSALEEHCSIARISARAQRA
jgi:tetratricopeptide (TPR) repeat protein